MLVYQLRANGVMHCFDRKHFIFSKNIFKDKDKAESYKNTFKEKCCLNGLEDLDPDTTIVEIVELELE